MNSSICILTYHGLIDSPLKIPDWCFLDIHSFQEHVRFLKKHFDLISLTEVTARFQSENHRPAVVITFDDGFKNNYDLALPILTEENVPATIFLVTGLIGTEDTVWFCRLNEALGNTTLSSFQWLGEEYSLVSTAEKSATSNRIQSLLKTFPQPLLLSELRRLMVQLNVDPDAPIPEDSPFRMLRKSEVSYMLSTGLIEIGAHTQSHAILSLLSPDERRKEIVQSLEFVQMMKGSTCGIFAYPNGLRKDYDSESIEILQQYGVTLSVTSIEGMNYGNMRTMELRRYGIGPHLEQADFERLLHREHESMRINNRS